VISVALVVIVSVAFTRLRRNRFLTDGLDWNSRKDAGTSIGGSRSADAEYGGQTVDDTSDDENYSDEDIDVVTGDFKSPSSSQSFQTLSVKAASDAHAQMTAKPTQILDSDLDPEDVPVDLSGERLSKLYVRSRDQCSEDELNTLEIHRGTVVGQLPVITAATEPTLSGTVNC